MNNNLPNISVIIECSTTWNPRECLAALSQQSLPSHFFEVIVCTANPESLSRDHWSSELKVSVVRTLPKRSALEIGIEKSNGAIIIALPSFCIPHLDFLERHVRAHVGLRNESNFLAVTSRRFPIQTCEKSFLLEAIITGSNLIESAPFSSSPHEVSLHHLTDAPISFNRGIAHQLCFAQISSGLSIIPSILVAQFIKQSGGKIFQDPSCRYSRDRPLDALSFLELFKSHGIASGNDDELGKQYIGFARLMPVLRQQVREICSCLIDANAAFDAPLTQEHKASLAKMNGDVTGYFQMQENSILSLYHSHRDLARTLRTSVAAIGTADAIRAVLSLLKILKFHGLVEGFACLQSTPLRGLSPLRPKPENRSHLGTPNLVFLSEDFQLKTAGLSEIQTLIGYLKQHGCYSLIPIIIRKCAEQIKNPLELLSTLPTRRSNSSIEPLVKDCINRINQKSDIRAIEDVIPLLCEANMEDSAAALLESLPPEAYENQHLCLFRSILAPFNHDKHHVELKPLDSKAILAMVHSGDVHSAVQRVLANARDQSDASIQSAALALENSPTLTKALLASNEAKSDWRNVFSLAKSAARSGCLACCRAVSQKILQWQPDYWFARELPRQLEGYYSQLDQDRFIERFFTTNGARFRRFIEVGAFDGVHYSNTRRLALKYGWQGISIEPVRKNHQRLIDSYAGTSVECLRLAASNREGRLEINVSTYPHLPEWGTDVASLEASETSRWGKYGAVWSKEKVEVTTINNLLQERKIIGFDLISVDVEGHDLAVLQGVDFNLHKPSLVIVEYSSNRDSILGYMINQGYGLARDNGQDLFLERTDLSTSVELAAKSHFLQPNLVENWFRDDELLVEHRVSPQALVTPERFDLPMKILYARSKLENWNTSWAEACYCEHISAFNGFHENDNKVGRQRFLDDFQTLIVNVERSGFSSEISLVPVDNDNVLVDGAHRTAICALLNQSITVIKSLTPAPHYNSDWFKRRGLSDKAADASALEYTRWNPDCRFVIVFPAAAGKDDELVQSLQGHGKIVCRRTIDLMGQGPELLIWQLYRRELWVGEPTTNWSGILPKARGCFPNGKGAVRVFLLEPNPTADLRSLKERIRASFAVANHSVHINDSHSETITIAKIFFNENSIHFLNNARLVYLPTFWHLLTKFEAGVLSQGETLDRFCIDGSAVLSAYGLRDCRDIDFIHTGIDDVSFGNPNSIGSHNLCASYHVTSIDDIIHNPDNHFYFHGVRFASLGVIRAMKKNRAEGKDSSDISLIDGLLMACKGPDIRGNPPQTAFNWKTRPKKIVGLVTVRNESAIIGQCLRCLSRFTDEIIVLDDASTDQTISVCQSLKGDCNIRHIIGKRIWYRDEPNDRNRLLNAGRSIGGTHFIVIDADEIFTSNFIDNDELRNALLSLAPGDALEVQWLQLWRDTIRYRNDNSVWSNSYKSIAFADNWSSFYSSEFIHTPRIPGGLRGRTRRMTGPITGLMHFQFVCWRNLLIKQAWYRCLERIRLPNKPASDINLRYRPSKDETGIILSPARPEWFARYDDFDHTCYQTPDSWRFDQVLAWFSQYGKQHFEELEIWDVDWNPETPTDPPSSTGSSLGGDSNGAPFHFTNNWFQTHEANWNRLLLPFIGKCQPIQILEIGSFEGRSTCWFLMNAMSHSASRITCVDTWDARGTNAVPGDECVFHRFKKNCQFTGKSERITIIRQDSKLCLPTLNDSSFDIIYVDGDHSPEGSYSDSINSFRLIKKGGLIIWDDYLWSESVRSGVDRACTESGVTVSKFGENVCYLA